MNRKRLLLSALPLVVLTVALWFIGKYQPKTVEIEGSGSQTALRALAKACEDFPLARQITLKRTRADSAVDEDTLIYNRLEHTLKWAYNIGGYWRIGRVEEEDVRALSQVEIRVLDGHDIDTDGFDFLGKRGCRLIEP
jgi:hypothetical protein